MAIDLKVRWGDCSMRMLQVQGVVFCSQQKRNSTILYKLEVTIANI